MAAHKIIDELITQLARKKPSGLTSPAGKGFDWMGQRGPQMQGAWF